MFGQRMIRRVCINKSCCTAGLVIVLLTGSAAPATSQSAGVLASVKSVSCSFPVSATGTWNSGEPHAEVKSAGLSLKFDSINTDDGTAQMIGNYGAADIIVRLTNRTLHFVQMFLDGPLYTTTIFPKETRSKKLQAVHTRHEFTEVSLPGFTSRPEQYYGECEVQQ
jgi:hypothetical protein